MKKLILPCLLLAAGRAFAGDPVVVHQKDRAFTVRQIQVDTGDTVRFDNDDDFGHQVYARSPSFSFDTDETEPGNHADIRFSTAGHYRVLCHIHPKMRLDVDVK